MREINRLQFRTKNELVYEELRKMIISGTLAPDERLYIKYLAQALGVSESPIREAIKRLISENFVIEKGLNLYVASLCPQQFLEMLDIRLQLEMIAVKQAAKYINADSVQSMRELLAAMKSDFAIGNFPLYYIAHRDFHKKCFSLCNIPYLVSALNEALDHHERGINIFKLTPWRKNPNIEQHERIVDLLEQGDTEGAVNEWQENRKCAFSFYSEQLQKKNII